MSAPAHKGQHDYRPDIDGLRAVAILGVIAYHSGLPGVSGGFVGVDVFFVISGYLITQLLVREIDRTGTLSIADFYARRARRLLPALSVVLLATLSVGYFLLPPTPEREQLAASAIASSFFVANHYFLSATGGYFDGPSELKPLLHLWSLAVEEQFYLVWPLLLIVIARLASVSRRLQWMRAVTVIIGVASFALSVWLVNAKPQAAFFIAPSRAWELGIGAMLALGVPALAASRTYLHTLAASGGLALVAASYVLINPGTRFPGAAATLPVLGSAALIWGNSAGSHWVARLFGTRPMVEIGKLSYGWYLWHWPVLSLAHSWRLMETNSLADVACSGFALGLAWLTLRYIENPVRYGPRFKSLPTPQVLFRGATAIGGGAALATVLFFWGAALPKSEREQFAMRVSADHPSQRHMDCLVDRASWDGKLPLQQCTFGNAQLPIELIVWGDSHAMSWTPALDEMERAGKLRYVQLTMSGCRPLAPEVIDRYSPTCREFRRQVLEAVGTLRAQGLKGIVLAGRWPPMSNADVPIASRPQHHPGLRELLSAVLHPSQAATTGPADELPQALTGTFKALQQAQTRALVLLDPPELKYPVPNCVFVNFGRLERCGIDRDYYARNFGGVAATFGKVAADFPSVRAIDPVRHFCNDAACPAVSSQGTPSLYDADHITASAARAVGAGLAGDLDWLLGRAPRIEFQH